MSLINFFDHFTVKPVTNTWTIDNFEQSSNCKSPRIVLSSSTSSSKTEVYLYLRPNEDLSCVTRKHVVVFLNSCDYISLHYRISLINQEGLKWNTQEGRAKIGNWDSMGFNGQYIIKRDYLLDPTNDLLTDGRLVIYCEVFELNDAECIQSGVCKDNLVLLSQDNESLLDSGKLSDVVLAVGAREFKAHKLILSTRSVVFEKMFEHDLKESKRNRVEITDMSAGACEDLLKFIYTGKVGDLDRHAYELYVAAHKYQIDSLASHCEFYLSMSLSVSSVPKVLQLADLYSLEELKLKCFNFIILHSTEFEYKDWKELTSSRPKLMYRVFKSLGNKKPK